MAQKDNILQELNELKSTLANLPAQNVYSVPAGYFDGLASQVLNRIKAMEATTASEEIGYLSPILSNISKQMPYSVPAGYFEELDLEHITKENDTLSAKGELETLSPLLAGLKKEMPYQVPQGYFDNLAPAIPADEDQSATKVVSLGSRKWFRYAAAAVMVGVIATIAVMVISRNANPQGQSLARYEKKLNKEIKKMSDKELDDFIQYTEAGLEGNENVKSNSPDDVKELLKDVPVEELKEFLEETTDPESDSETSMMN